jgi:thiamine pyrophosphokinase
MSDEQAANCVWVLAASPVWDPATPFDRLPRPDAVIAADGGSTLATHLGLMPDLLVGDLDSSQSAILRDFESRGVPVARYDHNTKWETDTELAVLAALERHPRTIILLGALGARLDHSLANILLLTHPALAETDLRVIDGPHELTLAKPRRWNEVLGNLNDIVTLLPVGQDAHGVTTRGLRYPLSGETLLVGRGRGVSNRIAAAGAAVWLDSGLLLIAVEHV